MMWHNDVGFEFEENMDQWWVGVRQGERESKLAQFASQMDES